MVCIYDDLSEIFFIIEKNELHMSSANKHCSIRNIGVKAKQVVFHKIVDVMLVNQKYCFVLASIKLLQLAFSFRVHGPA